MKTFMRILERTLVLALLIALGTWLFYIGREHQVFLDNKSIERDGKNFRALEQVNVSVNGGTPVELLARDRDVAVTVGPKFSLRVEILDSMGGDVERVVELSLEPGFDKDLMVSLPLLAALRADFILPPPAVAAPKQEGQSPLPGGEPAPAADELMPAESQPGNS
ncbi:MAG: hypothetical protein IJU98_05770 [Synergistaceae bacterium]|nr:hypothetical protein [Synergistaceae bacterium]